MKALMLLIVSTATLLAQSENTMRKLQFNGIALTASQQAKLEAIELAQRFHLPDGAYWYDNRTGVAGFWNGPAAVVLPAGLDLGGPMQANCSGGGTGVFVNGRELHLLDVAMLARWMPVYRGRFWVDARGDFGMERGPRIGNLIQLAMQGQQSNTPHRVYSPGELSGVIVNPAGACTNSGCFYR